MYIYLSNGLFEKNVNKLRTRLAIKHVTSQS